MTTRIRRESYQTYYLITFKTHQREVEREQQRGKIKKMLTNISRIMLVFAPVFAWEIQENEVT